LLYDPNRITFVARPASGSGRIIGQAMERLACHRHVRFAA
jgi:hypothetical protein